MQVPFLLLLVSIFVSCSSETPPDESFKGIGVLGYRKKIALEEGRYMEVPAFNYFVFMYHDSIFEIELDSLGKSTCYRIDYNPEEKHIADIFFTSIHNGNLQIPLKEYKGSCAPDIIYLGNKDGEFSVFSGLQYDDVELLFDLKQKRTKIRASKQPKIFTSKIYEFDSRYLRHYFSESYLYKDVRVIRSVDWTTNDK